MCIRDRWGIGSASVVLEAAARADTAPSLCLVYPSVSAMPTVGPVTLGPVSYTHLDVYKRQAQQNVEAFFRKEERSHAVPQQEVK